MILPLTLKRSILVALLLVSFFSCRQTKKTRIDPAFKAYIAAFTSGTISAESPVRIRFNNEIANAGQFNAAIEKQLFNFSPAVKGKAYWIDARTIEFRPDEPLESGQLYEVDFSLAGVINVPDKFSTFPFSFQVIQQMFDVSIDGLRAMDNRNFNYQLLIGAVNTADVADAEQIEKVLKAKQGNRDLTIHWTHDESRKIHSFTVDSIQRSQDSTELILSWDGSAIDVDLKGTRSVVIPALGDFIFMHATVVQQETEQYVVLQFSDPLDEAQNLQGLITLGGLNDLRFIIEGNTIRLYPSARQTSTLVLQIDAAVKNAIGKTLTAAVTADIVFEEIKI